MRGRNTATVRRYAKFGKMLRFPAKNYIRRDAQVRGILSCIAKTPRSSAGSQKGVPVYKRSGVRQKTNNPRKNAGCFSLYLRLVGQE